MRIGSGTTIKAKAKLDTGATIGTDVEIGERATVGDHVRIERQTKVGDDATLSGGRADDGNTTYIHERARIGAFTHIGSCTHIGVETHIGDDCHIKEWCRIDHEVTVHDSVNLGQRTHVETGAVLNDSVITLANSRINRGAEIGTDAEVRSEAPVRAGTRVPTETVLDGEPHKNTNADPDAPAKPVVRGAGRPVGGGTASTPDQTRSKAR